MKWIRIDAGIACDPKLQQLADTLGVRLPHAIGLVICALCQFPAHARDGDIGAIPDATLEKWAGWEGKRGKFAPAFRATFCVDGVVTGWEKHNGAAVRKADKDTERQAEYRAKKGGRPPDAPPPVTRDNTRDNTRDIVRDETRRDVTAADAAVRAAASSLTDRFGDPRHRAEYEAARRSHRFPESLDAMLVGLSEGQGAPRMHPLSWHQLGQAILDLRAQQRDLSTVSVGSFAAKVPKAPVAPTLTLMPKDDPGTVRDATGALIWDTGAPIWDRPADDEIAARGWSVAS
jgi:hypothetical protein